MNFFFKIILFSSSDVWLALSWLNILFLFVFQFPSSRPAGGKGDLSNKKPNNFLKMIISLILASEIEGKNLISLIVSCLIVQRKLNSIQI